METKISSVLSLILMITLDVCAFELTISPINMHVLPRQRVKVMCQADVPLVGCQFKRVFSNSLYDLSLGQQSPYSRDFGYYGNGLSTGQCGITLTEYVREHTYDIITCRARAADGGWKYAQMSLVINSNATFRFSITPPRPVVLPGGNVTVLCQADQAVSSCLFKWNNTSWTIVNESSNAAEYRYSGAGLDRGQCGITFLNAKPTLSGNVICSAWTKSRPKGYEAATSPLVIADAPNAPILTIAYASVPANGTLAASCIIRQVRPMPRITWLLAGKVVGEETCVDAAGADWRWPYEAGDCEAMLVLRVDWQDNNQDLVCRVEHAALPGGRVDLKQVVNVTFAPVAPSASVALHGFRTDQAAEVEVHVSANPRPTFVWTFANATLAEGESLDGDRVQALRATKNDCGWQAKLVISSLAQSDLEEEVLLTATNKLGSADIQLLLNTAPTSADVITLQCEGRVQHLEPDVVVPARIDSLKHEVQESTNCPLTGLTIAILLLVLIVVGTGVWYTQSRWRWCMGRKQFSRSSLRDDAEETDDADSRRAP